MSKNSMFEKVLTPVVRKITENSIFSKSNHEEASISKSKTMEHRDSITENNLSIKLEKPTSLETSVDELRNGYMGIKSTSIGGASPEPSDSPSTSKSNQEESCKYQKDMNDDKKEIRLTMDDTENGVKEQLVVVVDDKNEIIKEQLSVAIDTGIKKAVNKTVNSGKKVLNDLKRQKNPDELIQNLMIDKDGKKTLNIKNFKFEYLEYNDKLKSLDVDKWAHWIYDEYISNRADYVINIAYRSRLIIQHHFDSTYRASTVTAPTDVDGAAISKINTNDLGPDIFDEAQNEVWTLMANDSLSHFKRTAKYKQLRSFFQT